MALMALAVLASSTQLRNWVWVTISRNLYEYKYDYRDEWRRLTERLADSDADRTLGESVIIGMSDIVHSPAGALWLSDGAERWLPDTQHGCSWDFQLAPEDQQQLRDFFAEREWIIDLKQLRADPKHYPDLRLSGELLEVPQLRFLLPLQVESELVGLLMLAEPRIPIDLIWEDYDLLKVAARQVANALSQSRASEALSYAREFEAFHQMSAFVVHDLKTVVAQLSLMVQNAEKHRTNPAFFDDMISTNANAVDRMQRLLQQLREPARNDQTRINAVAVVAQAIARHDANQPPPSLSSSSPELYCEADEERLTAVIGHIISNAQDACDADGQITARISADQQWLKIEIQDNGCGMDEEFLRKRLFQPFESTKGIAGMGVGVYQTREYLRSLGGNLQVSSTVGSGSTFVLTLPVSR